MIRYNIYINSSNNDLWILWISVNLYDSIDMNKTTADHHWWSRRCCSFFFFFEPSLFLLFLNDSSYFILQVSYIWCRYSSIPFVILITTNKISKEKKIIWLIKLTSRIVYSLIYRQYHSHPIVMCIYLIFFLLCIWPLISQIYMNNKISYVKSH